MSYVSEAFSSWLFFEENAKLLSYFYGLCCPAKILTFYTPNDEVEGVYWNPHGCLFICLCVHKHVIVQLNIPTVFSGTEWKLTHSLPIYVL